MKKFLVTGAAGFIGSHSVDYLLSQGHAVVGLDNLRTGNLANLAMAQASPYFKLIEEDACNHTAMETLFRNHQFTGVLHLAALVSVPESFEQPALNYAINLAATESLARLCIQYGCNRLVFASSAAVYGNRADLPNRETALPHPCSPYAAAKLASEAMLMGYGESYGLETLCLRYFNVYGPRQDPRSPYSGVLSIFSDRFQAGLPITIYGDGEQTRDFIAVQDVARINGEMLNMTSVVNGYYNVCTGRSVSLNRVLEIYREYYPNAPSPRYDKPRIGDIRHSVGDPERLKKVLGMTAQISFEQGLNLALYGFQGAESELISNAGNHYK